MTLMAQAVANDGWGGGGWEKGSLAPVKHLEPAKQVEVDAFIAEHPSLDANVKQKFKDLKPKLQRVVLAQGLSPALKNPSAVLQKLCKELNHMKEGDWICPNCTGVLYSWQKCNKCNMAKPV